MTQDEIRKLPHKVVGGVAIALTEEEIAFHTAPQPESEKIANLKQSIAAKCKAYLVESDWQIIRLSDPTSGESLKEGVAEKRALARSIQDDIAREDITLEELNNINIGF